MPILDFTKIINSMANQTVERPNKSSAGTLSGHAAGEPFEKCVYHKLKQLYPNNIYKQFEYLNDIYLKHPKHISLEQRYALMNSPTALFLLSRGDKATKEWSPENIFEEKQNDTADILYYKNGFYDIIDVKTRNISKSAMAPNWKEKGNSLTATKAFHGNLFKANPETLYINWAAAMQIQFHVCELDQSWNGTREEWTRHYLNIFVKSAKMRCKKMHDTYIKPFLRYIRYSALDKG